MLSAWFTYKIQLDEIFRNPELLATILFSTFFITIPNTDGNSLQFAKHVLLTALPDVTDTTQLDKRLISFVAISILTVVCFIHYFSRNSGLLLNLVFAVYKTILVFIFVICGCVASGKPDNGKSDWGDQPIPSKNILAAMIYIIYSYQGWENANYVRKIAKSLLNLYGLIVLGRWWTESQESGSEVGCFLSNWHCHFPLYYGHNGICKPNTGAIPVSLIWSSLLQSLACKFNELAGQDLGVVLNFAPKVFYHFFLPPGEIAN